jgi:hypothetical protein
MVKVHVTIQRVDTKAYFESWNETRYEVILGLVWLKQVGDSWHSSKIIHPRYRG